MAARFQYIGRLVCTALAAFNVVRLDARTRPAAAEIRPVSFVAVADSRAHRRGQVLPHTAPFEGFEIPDAMRDSIVDLARAQVGRRYRFGGTTPERGFDCSGLVRYVLAQLHVRIPRLAAQQARVGTPIEPDRLRPGDLLAFGARDSVSHIGIYIGSGRFVHASSVAGRVIESPLDRPASRLIKPLRGARRLLAVKEL